MAAEKDKSPAENADSTEKIGLVKRIKTFSSKVIDRCLTPKFMLSAAAISFAIHGCLYWYYSNQPGPQTREVALGSYHYEAYANDGSVIGRPVVTDAQFELHVSLLENVDQRARELMQLREHKLRQSIEELIRQARDREFSDPQLVELKRRLLEQINHTLGIKAVDEVLITDLRLSVDELAVPPMPGDEPIAVRAEELEGRE